MGGGWEIFGGGLKIFFREGGWKIFGGVRNFRGGLRNFGGGLRFFSGGVWKFSGVVEIFFGRVWDFFGGLRNFRGIEKFSRRLNFFSFSRGVGIFRKGLRFSSIVSVMVKQFSRGGGRGKNFSGGLRFFREGFKLFLERWNWDFLMGEVLEGTSRELKIFQMG